MSSILLRRNGPNSASQGAGKGPSVLRNASGTPDQESIDLLALIHHFRPYSPDPSWVGLAKGLPRPRHRGTDLVIMVPQEPCAREWLRQPGVISRGVVARQGV